MLKAKLSRCGHCKRAKPEFTEAAAQYRDDSKVRGNLMFQITFEMQGAKF